MARRRGAEIAEDLRRELDLPQEEGELYLRSLMEGLVVVMEGNERMVRSMAARGIIIREGKGTGFRPVHPRLAMSNLFRLYESSGMREEGRREKRMIVDRLTLEIIAMLQEQTKGKYPAPRKGVSG